jgi:peptide/nickel transport system substrate-binding protein
MKRLTSILVALVLIVSSLLVSCSPSAPSPTQTAPKPSATGTTQPKPTPTATTASQPQYGGVLKIGTEEVFPTSMGVPGKTSPTGIAIVNAIVEHLVRIDRSGTILPWLISSWNFSQNGLKLTFNLVKGIKFHDGTDWNAQAAKWNIEKCRESRSELNVIKSIDVLDDYTIAMNLSSYSCTLLPNFVVSDGFIMSPTAYQKNGEAGR